MENGTGKKRQSVDKSVLELRKLAIQENTPKNKDRTLHHMLQLLNAFEREIAEINPNSKTGTKKGAGHADSNDNS